MVEEKEVKFGRCSAGTSYVKFLRFPELHFVYFNLFRNSPGILRLSNHARNSGIGATATRSNNKHFEKQVDHGRGETGEPVLLPLI